MAWSTLLEFTQWGVPLHTVWDGAWESIVGDLNAAQADIEEALRTAGDDLPIPLTSVSAGMKRRECVIAGYNHLRVRGWEATSSSDAEFVKEYERCLAWIDKVATGKLKPLPVTPAGEVVDADPTTEPTGAGVASEASRNWGALWP
jgi:phage gp36-like protein